MVIHDKVFLQVDPETYKVYYDKDVDVEAIRKFFQENNITKGEDLIPDWQKEAYKKDIQRADIWETMIELVKLVQSHPLYPLP